MTTFVGATQSSSAYQTASWDLSATGLPAGTAVDDLCLIAVAGNRQDDTPAPAGWTIVANYKGNAGSRVLVYARILTALTLPTLTWSAATLGGVGISVWRGLGGLNVGETVTGQATGGTTISIPLAGLPCAPGDVDFWASSNTVGGTAGLKSLASTETADTELTRWYFNAAPYPSGNGGYILPAAAGTTSALTLTNTVGVGGNGISGSAVRIRFKANAAPNAPTLTSLTGGEVIDLAAVNRATHTFSDPDAGDTQSAFDHRYRLVGAATWTTAYVSSPNGYVDYPAGTFAAGNYERQVRTYDSKGTVGAWSSSGFFTAANAPATPTITAPIQNETITTATRDVTWSAPSQDAYQLQVLDGGVVLYDTGTIVSAARTREAVPFPDNGTTRTIRVRVRYGGLWSSWYAIAVTVSYDQPPVPTVALSASGTAIVVQVTNPAPGVGQVAAVTNDVLVTEDGREERRAIVAPNGSWTYRLPKSGLDYAGLIRVEAVASSGSRSSS